MMPLQERADQARATSTIGLVVGTIFSIFNLLTPGQTALGLAELFGVVVFVVPAAILARNDETIAQSETCLLLATGTIFGSLVVFGGVGGTGIYWVYTAPFVAFFIKGQRQAWIFCLSLWVLTGLYLLWLFPYVPFGYNYGEIPSLHAWLALGFYTVVAAAFAHIRVRYAEKLQLAKERAEEDVVAKSRFLAAASHDLRQPAHALGMFVARLQQLKHEGQAAELVQGVDASVRALQHMLDEFFDYSRMGLATMEVRNQDVSLERLLGSVRDSFSSQAQAKGIRLRVRPSRLHAEADPALLQRILVNLVANAVQYTHEGGVLVACRRCNKGRSVRIEVWDSGVGIAAEQQDKVFGEFYQVENPERDRSKGFGLGLSIVRLACQRGGYVLGLQSTLGRGSRFSVTVPLHAAASPSTQSPAGPAACGGEGLFALQGRKVLLLEDDPLGGAAVQRLLGGWGCEVVLALSAEDAFLRVDQGFVPDVMVSDFRLPGGQDGLQAIARIRGRCGDVPACLVSGDTDPELRERVQATGIPLLQKPVRPAKLRAALRNLLAQTPTPSTR
ncbi:hybrid sensor histidine kinase/response regulator [Curvibacter sp. APW13]|uniref:ATP-binding response regulator n=1 Tax=Curvibacter sp. APW13 TaxID=3077236 RepID=UPI0028DF9B80|nr:hybrid sensor histidine kinase/response regulator [Curvibacter sp. APW13]MDT8992311.1 hybrid sensor histidine kinase/response regulator [Curvibacter sp. APW13]